MFSSATAKPVKAIQEAVTTVCHRVGRTAECSKSDVSVKWRLESRSAFTGR
jgi:hypothetical protein